MTCSLQVHTLLRNIKANFIIFLMRYASDNYQKKTRLLAFKKISLANTDFSDVTHVMHPNEHLKEKVNFASAYL